MMVFGSRLYSQPKHLRLQLPCALWRVTGASPSLRGWGVAEPPGANPQVFNSVPGMGVSDSTRAIPRQKGSRTFSYSRSAGEDGARC